MVAAQAGGPSRPPANIEDFLWNMHSVLAATPGPLHLDNLKEAYSKHLGHKCGIERFLVVGEGGLGATLKRIPHIVTLFTEGGVPCVRATQAADCTKQQLMDADGAYRRELIKRNAAAKAKAVATTASKAPPPQGEKRPAEPAPAAAAGDPKKPRTDDAETLARMLVQGVVRVVQNRQKAGKGPLPVSELEEEFKALWKVPFNLQQAGETDVVTFLQKWPQKVEVIANTDSSFMVQLSKKAAEKAKGAAPAKEPGAPPAKAEATAAKSAPPTGPSTAAKSAAVTAAKTPATATASKAPAPPPASKAPAEAAVAKNGPGIPKRAGGPTRPPASIEDFLFNIHSVLEVFGEPMPLDQLKEAYSKHLGHKCSIERFLVVGEGGLAATLKRIPHIVTVVHEKDAVFLKSTLPAGTTKEQLVAADLQYRKQLQAKNAAAKAKAAIAKAPEGATPVPAEAPATAVKAAAPTRPAEDAPEGERDAKKPRTEDAETLSRMLVQGIVRVLQNRQKDGKGPLPIGQLKDEFQALWKVPFNLQQAGETDAVTFLQKWPNKVEVLAADGGHTVQLAKKAAEKAKGVPAAPALVTKGPPAVAPPMKAAPPPKASATESPPEAEAPVAANVIDEAAGNILQTVPELRAEAAKVLEAMQALMRRQEALVSALAKMES